MEEEQGQVCGVQEAVLAGRCVTASVEALSVVLAKGFDSTQAFVLHSRI